MTARHLLAALLVAVLAPACETQSAQPISGTEGQTGLQIIPLTIESRGRRHRFRVEVARSGEEQNRGLMFRTTLADNAGMLFPSATPEVRSFWMKNTPLALDLIFIREDGAIARITEETTPYSLDQIPSGEPVIAVLEIRGGRAAELGIAEGDLVGWDRAKALP